MSTTTLGKTWSFSLRISSVNVTKGIFEFGDIYWRNPQWKTSFLMQCHGWPKEKIFGFRWSKKVKIRLETIKVLAKCFYQCSQIFSIFIYNESLPMKSHRFLKIYKRFEKKRKNNEQQSMRKEKLRKLSLTLFYNSLFYNPLKWSLIL